MKRKMLMFWMVAAALVFLGACASMEKGEAQKTSAAGGRFASAYAPYEKHPELFTLLQGDYGRLTERQGNYWDFSSPGFSFAQVKHIYIAEVGATAPEPLKKVREGYAEEFKDTLATHFKSKGYVIDSTPGDLVLESNLWRLDDTAGGRAWIPFNFGQWNAALGVEMKVVDKDGKLLYAMVYDNKDFNIKKAFDKFQKDFDQLSP